MHKAQLDCRKGPVKNGNFWLKINPSLNHIYLPEYIDKMLGGNQMQGSFRTRTVVMSAEKGYCLPMISPPLHPFPCSAILLGESEDGAKLRACAHTVLACCAGLTCKVMIPESSSVDDFTLHY